VDVPVYMRDFNWLLSLLDHPKANWLVRSAFSTDQTPEEWDEVYRTYAEWCEANGQTPLAPTIDALREVCREEKGGHDRLTYRSQGRNFRLTDVEG
jgi:hypothetical protein